MEKLTDKPMGRPLILPGLVLTKGDEVIIIDSRGRVIHGIFMGYSSSFVALAPECGSEPTRFVNIRRIVEVVIVRRAVCNENSV